MAEGAPLLREYRVYSSIEGSNPSFSAILKWVKCEFMTVRLQCTIGVAEVSKKKILRM